MIRKAMLKLSQVAEKYRPALWVLLFLLTMAILYFPVHLEYEYRPVQSPYIFGSNLPLFGALYCIWMLLLLVLIFSRREAKWEKLALVCLFAVVFLGFWTIITPYFRHHDEWYNAAHVEHLLQAGGVSLHWETTPAYLGYFGWPGLHFIGSTICQITGLSIFKARTLFVIFGALLFPALLYVLFLRSLKNPSISAIAVLLVIVANITISKVSLFFPAYLGYMFMLSFLILLNRHEYTLLETWQDRLIMIVLFLAATMTHLITSLALIFILAGIYLVQKRGKKTLLTSAGSVALFLIIVVTWEMYWRRYTLFDTAGPALPETPGSALPETPGPALLSSPDFSLRNLLLLAKTTIGGRSPLWATGIRLFWWVSIYAFGSILWIKSLFRMKGLSPLEKKEVGGLAGIIGLTIVVTLAGQGGAQFIRFIMYAVVFTVPIVLRFFFNLGEYKRRYSFALLVILLFALSLPTFFVYNNMVSINATYPCEISARKFLESNYGEGEDLTLYSSIFATPINAYYLPKAELRTEPDYLGFKDKNDLWPGVGTLIREFEKGHGVFMYSKRSTALYENVFGFKSTHPEWLKLRNELSDENKVYANGYNELYVPAKPGS